MAFYPLERLMNLYDGYRNVFHVAGQSLLLVQDEGRTYLMLNQCPHQRRPLDRATVVGGSITCPHHGMCFDLNTGKTADGCSHDLQFIRIAYEGNQVGVDV
jgi:nitrite reductase/ring-hydroxylating ferredoxin subunit